MVIVMVLMVPTMIYVHLRMPRFRRVMEVITILPIVIPPIVLIVGVDGVTPFWLKSSQWLLALIYVVLAMPYVYRSLDAGLGALDLKTLVEASRSLGSGVGLDRSCASSSQPAQRAHVGVGVDPRAGLR